MPEQLNYEILEVKLLTSFTTVFSPNLLQNTITSQLTFIGTNLRTMATNDSLNLTR